MTTEKKSISQMTIKHELLLVSRISLNLMISAALNVEGDDVVAEILAVLLEQPLRHLGCELVVVFADRLNGLTNKWPSTYFIICDIEELFERNRKRNYGKPRKTIL